MREYQQKRYQRLMQILKSPVSIDRKIRFIEEAFKPEIEDTKRMYFDLGQNWIQIEGDCEAQFYTFDEVLENIKDTDNRRT